MSLLSLIPGSPTTWLRLGLAAAIFSAGAWSGRAWEKDTTADLRLERAQYDRDQARSQATALITQADMDRETLAARERKLTEVERNAKAWQKAWKELQRDPTVKAWSDADHPPAVGKLLNSP